jgi:hypothetical protein
MENRFRQMHGKILQHKEIYVATLVLLLFIFYNFTKLKMVNFDHLAFNNYTFMGHLKRAYEFTVEQQSRPNFVSLFTTAIEYINTSYYWVWAILYVFFIGLSGSLVVKELTKSEGMTYLAFLLITGFSVISLEPISMPSAYAFIYGSGVVSILLSVYFTLKYSRTQQERFKLLAVFCVLFSSFEYEVGLLFIPVLIGINCVHIKSLSIRENWKKSKEFVFAGLFYMMVYFIVKHTFGGGSYEGTHISQVFDPLKIIYTWTYMFIANIPGFFFFYDKSAAYRSPLHEIHNYGDKILSLSFLSSNFITLSLAIQVVLFAYLLYKIYKVYEKERCIVAQKKLNNAFFERILPVIIALYTILFPMFPSSLTLYTQDQVQSRWRLVGIGNQYSYVFLIVGFVCLLYLLGPKLANKKGGCLILAGVLTLQFAMTGFTNEKNSNTIDTLGTRFEQLDMVIDDMAHTVGENGLIFTQSLNASSGIMSIPSFYFTSHFKYTTNIGITVTNNIKDIKDRQNVYFLRYLYSDDPRNALFVLSRQTAQEVMDFNERKEDIGTELLGSNEIKVYSFNTAKNYDILGRVMGDKYSMISVGQNGQETNIATHDLIKYPMHNTLRTAGRPSTVTFSGDQVNVFSLCALPQYHATVEKVESINLSSDKVGNTLNSLASVRGKYEDGWIGENCEFKIQTGAKGKLLFKGYYPNKITGKETGIINVNDKETAFTISENSFSIEVNAPINSIATVKIVNKFSFAAKPPDTRKLSFILSDVEGQ